jgi:hypothetical protein
VTDREPCPACNGTGWVKVLPLCTSCLLPVDMALTGGVVNKHGRPFHDVCLKMLEHQSEGDRGDADCVADLAASGRSCGTTTATGP